MVALEMPREFVSHPVMKQVSECLVKTISRYVKSVMVNSVCFPLPYQFGSQSRLMADSLRDGQRDPTRHGDVFQVNVHVNLFQKN